jgi:BASS family bile acid:Na+ symporter
MKRTTVNLASFAWIVAALGPLAAVAGWLLGRQPLLAGSIVACLAAAALAFMSSPTLRSYAFTVWVFAFVAMALFYPAVFQELEFTVGGTPYTFHQKILIVPLIQIIMFGMGTTLSLRDFTRVAAMPWPVLIGMVLQFSVMPAAGYLLAKSFGFENEIAAGVVLIGSCPGGVASNLMAYLARGNVALSVTMTACSTLMSPLATPYLMYFLGGEFVEVNILKMMITIVNLILVPIVAGLLAHQILYRKKNGLLDNKGALTAIAIACIAAAVVLGMLTVAEDMTMAAELASLRNGIVVGLAMVGLVTLTKLVVEKVLSGPDTWMDKTLPIVSMAGICYIIGIITALSRDRLLADVEAGVLPRNGLLLLVLSVALAAVVHNAIGYSLGYWLSRLARLSDRDCRTVAFEVGMQNGGMASALAIDVLESAKAALAPAIFGPWMNVSGSVLATWWHRKPVADVEAPANEARARE